MMAMELDSAGIDVEADRLGLGSPPFLLPYQDLPCRRVPPWGVLIFIAQNDSLLKIVAKQSDANV